MSPARLIFVDETGAATNMARRYGRSPRGQRLDGPIAARPLEKHAPSSAASPAAASSPPTSSTAP